MAAEKIGPYLIQAELGRGGMATVYLAYDPRFERQVAVKILPPEMLHADPQFRLRFEREARLIARLEHPAIVPVYDVGEDEGRPYFVMRYMNGGSLADRIKQGVFSIAEATRILEIIAPALEEAHNQGIVHRDLKPSNILFTANGFPCISDFGIAKVLQAEGSTLTSESMIIGTPAYMSPEQAAGKPIDHRTDIYALGIILFEMLTGRQPYQADTPMGVAIKHITDPVPNILEVNPGLPAWIQEVIARAMAKDPEQRYQTATELVNDLKAHLQQSAAVTRLVKTVPPAPPTRTLPRRRRFYPVLGGILIAGLLGLLGAGLWLSGFGRRSMAPLTPPTPSPLPLITQTESAASPLLPTATSLPTPSPAAEPSATPSPLPTETPAPTLAVLGGADQIAFLNANDIWIMNVDGSGLKQLTIDGAKKFNLEWLDRHTLIYLSGKTVKTVDIETLREDSITTFLWADYFEGFHLSPDRKQVAITLARELFVVPFDLETLRNVRKKSDLLAMNGCLYYSEMAVKEALWSDDGQKLALKIMVPTGRTRSDAIRIVDLNCGATELRGHDTFPPGRFEFKPTIVDYDWDGDLLFFLNSHIFRAGFGDLVFYNTFTHKFQRLAPIDNICCYRDATFSPDGTYVIFAFQDIRLGAAARVKLYYVPVDALSTGGVLTPLPLPDNFFPRTDEAPMPALRPAWFQP